MTVDSGSIAPLRGFLLTWATHIEIARNLDVASRLRVAEHSAQTLDRDDPAWKGGAIEEIRSIFDAARAAMSE